MILLTTCLTHGKGLFTDNIHNTHQGSFDFFLQKLIYIFTKLIWANKTKGILLLIGEKIPIHQIQN